MGGLRQIGRDHMYGKKKTKINLRITFKSHAHLQIMTKTPVKFQKDQHKTVGGVANTRYPIYIHADSVSTSKMTKLKCGKNHKS